MPQCLAKMGNAYECFASLSSYLERKVAERDPTRSSTIATTDEDVASAMLAALELKAGFQAFMISGDYEQKIMCMTKAERMLGWTPKARPAT